ncbi:MAG: diguanylate cyclase [Chloroflexi bacterium]|nr:diguanylate cyclase [Chloroflexota bacterium]
MRNSIENLELELSLVADPKARVDVLNELAWQVRHSDRERSKTLGEQARSLAVELLCDDKPYSQGLAASLRTLSYLNGANGNYNLALAQSLEAFDILERVPENALQIDVLCNIAWVYRGFGDYGIALDHAMKALKLAQASTDREREATVLDLISNIYSESNNLPEALPTYDRALAIYRELGLVQGESLVLNNLALTYIQMGRGAEAIEASLRSLQIAQENGLSSLVLTALGTTGEVYVALAECDNAIKFLKQALSIAVERGASYDRFWSLFNLGKVYLSLGDADSARSHLQSALLVSQTLDNRPGQFQCHELLAQLHERRGELADALAHYKQFHSLKETVFNEDAAKRLAGLQVIHQVETARRELEIHHLKTIELQKEIEERKSAQAALEKLATTDALTGLLNRREFFVLAEREFQRARQENFALSVILLDLDHFKRINDTLGHAIGDQALAAAAKTVRSCLREDEIVGRYGGDEFVILLPGSDLAVAAQVAERLHARVAAQSIPTERGPVALSISLGIEELGVQSCSLDILLDHADQAMYTAKRAGRNRSAAYGKASRRRSRRAADD